MTFVYEFVTMVALAGAAGFAAAGVAAFVLEGRRERRMARYRSNPDGYCAFGHFHPTRLEAEWCEASRGAGDL